MHDRSPKPAGSMPPRPVGRIGPSAVEPSLPGRRGTSPAPSPQRQAPSPGLRPAAPPVRLQSGRGVITNPSRRAKPLMKNTHRAVMHSFAASRSTSTVDNRGRRPPDLVHVTGTNTPVDHRHHRNHLARTPRPGTRRSSAPVRYLVADAPRHPSYREIAWVHELENPAIA